MKRKPLWFAMARAFEETQGRRKVIRFVAAVR